ncbi:MAG: hypothetical protein WCL32_23385, partial [Planctomycetota bacterium]
DRFDALLDGLAAGLNDAIADAVRDGTRLALKDAVIEILTDPTLRTKLRQAAAPEVNVTAQKPGFWASMKARISAVGHAIKNAAAASIATAATVAHSAVAAVRDPSLVAMLFANLKRLFWIGVSAGFAFAVVSYFAPHAVSAALSGAAGAVAVIALRAGNWTRRAVQTVALS